tara:strand:- start:10398 stop:11366 length:969 start_codon:yes stop_codon:yes gene_type:complete
MRRNRSKILAHKSVIPKKSKIFSNGSFVNLSKHNRVCISRKLGGIGDVLMATVALREFKRENANCHLTFAIDEKSTWDNTYGKLLIGADFIDKIIDKSKIRTERFEYYRDITSCCIEEENSNPDPRGRIEIFSSHIGVNKINNYIPFYKETNEEKEKHDNIFLEYKNKNKFFIHVASNEGKRSWGRENIKNLIYLINQKYKNCIIFVSDFNNRSFRWESIKNVINVSSLDIRESASYIKRSDLFIGPDSGLMHLAAAVKSKSLVIFGSIPPEKRIRYYDTHSSIRMDELGCIGCWYKPCPYNVKCMKDLSAERVFNKVKEMI